MESCLPAFGSKHKDENKNETENKPTPLRKHSSTIDFVKNDFIGGGDCTPASTSLPSIHPNHLRGNSKAAGIHIPLDLHYRAPSTPPRDTDRAETHQFSMSPCYKDVARFRFQGIEKMPSIACDETNNSQNNVKPPSPESPGIWFSAEYQQATPPPYNEKERFSTDSSSSHRRALFSNDSDSSLQDSDNQLIFQQISLDDEPSEDRPPPYTPVDMLSGICNSESIGRNALQLVASHPEIDEEIRVTIMHSIRINSFEVIRNSVTDDNLIHYLIAAEKLNLNALKELCELRYMKQLEKNNCLEIFQIASSYNCCRLMTESLNVVSQNFGSIWQTDVFRHLGGRTLMLIVINESIRTHPDIKSSLEWWLSYEKDCRERIYHELLQLLVKNSETGVDSVPTTSSIQNDAVKCSNSYITLLTCGTKNKYLKVVLIDMKRSKLSLPKMTLTLSIGPEYAACSGTISEAPYLFLSGGAERTKCLLKLDVVENKWKTCKKMNKARSRHIMEMISERIYVIGGFHNGNNLSSIEEYDTRKNTWRMMFDLIYPVRSAMSVVHQNSVYIFGGKLANNEPISSIQCFDPSKMSASVIGELPVTCSCGSAVVSDRGIFVATGNGELLLYDPELNTTVLCSTQLSKRKHFGMFWSDCKVYLVGGIRYVEPDSGMSPLLDSIDVYDPAADSWSLFGCIPEPLTFFTTCRVTGYKPFQQGFGHPKPQEMNLYKTSTDY